MNGGPPNAWRGGTQAGGIDTHDGAKRKKKRKRVAQTPYRIQLHSDIVRAFNKAFGRELPDDAPIAPLVEETQAHRAEIAAEDYERICLDADRLRRDIDEEDEMQELSEIIMI